MRPDITEFSYGYALTDNLIYGAGLNLVAAPVFPSLIEEGKTAGWDVKLGTPLFPLFLQFKVPDRMIGNRTIEEQKGLLKPPFYRIPIRALRQSKQHPLLLALEREGQAVFYVAPAFYRVEDLDRFYLSRQVVDNSVFIPPSAIGELPDQRDHHVAFKPETDLFTGASLRAFLLSEPKVLEVGTSERWVADLESRAQHTPTHWSLNALHHTLIDLLGPHLGEADINRLVTMTEKRGGVAVAAYLARVYFGAEMYLVGFRGSAPDL